MSSSNGCSRFGHSTRRSTDLSDDHGYALLVVLGILAVLSVIAVALSQRAQVSTAAATSFLEETRDLYAVEAGLSAAARALSEEFELDQEGRFRLEAHRDGRHLDIVISDETGKSDVNRASPGEIAEAFILLGADAGSALELSHRVIDWRDADQQSQPRGAEASDYLAAGSLAIPRNDSFVSLDEVETVLGLTSEFAGHLHEQFTLSTFVQGGGIRYPASIVRSPTLSGGLAVQGGDVPAADGITRRADTSAGPKAFGIAITLRRGSEQDGWQFYRLRNAGSWN